MVCRGRLDQVLRPMFRLSMQDLARRATERCGEIGPGQVVNCIEAPEDVPVPVGLEYPRPLRWASAGLSGSRGGRRPGPTTTTPMRSSNA